MNASQRWERHHGDYARYYQVWLEQDLLGDCVLTQAWGRVDSRRGRVVHTVCFSTDDAELRLKVIARRRLRHGYLPVQGVCV